jgi:hypothetical protein
VAEWTAQNVAHDPNPVRGQDPDSGATAPTEIEKAINTTSITKAQKATRTSRGRGVANGIVKIAAVDHDRTRGRTVIAESATNPSLGRTFFTKNTSEIKFETKQTVSSQVVRIGIFVIFL